MTPAEFHKKYMNWGQDVDGVAGVQCVDFFKEFLRLLGCITYKSPIGGDGYADNIWYNRNQWKDYFDFIPKGKFQDGDIVIFPHKKRGGWTHPSSHVCFYYSPNIEFGTNQGISRKACDKKTNYADALGALRWKGWEKEMAYLQEGYKSLTLNGHVYSVYKQKSDQKAVVRSAGAGKVKDFKQFGLTGKYTYATAAGANFYQMSKSASDPYGTTYGDMVAPQNGVYHILPNQANNLFYDLDTGTFGSIKNYYPDNSHNVFSPAVVFSGGTYMYAPMVGPNHVNLKSQYCGILQCNDGKYAIILGPANGTPYQMWTDFKSYGKNLAILDGGGSAQMGYWDGDRQQYIYKKYSGRPIPSIVVFSKDATASTSTTAKPAETKPAETKVDETKYVRKQAYDILLSNYNDLNKKYNSLVSKLKELVNNA